MDESVPTNSENDFTSENSNVPEQSDLKNSEDDDIIKHAKEALLKHKSLQSIFQNMNEDDVRKIVNKRINKFGSTLLHLAVQLDAEIAVKELLDNNADVNIEEGKYKPLHFVKSRKIAQLLIDNGADINAKDDFGESLLTKAAEDRNIKMVTFLIEKKADSTDAKKGFGLAPDCDDKDLIEILEYWHFSDECDDYSYGLNSYYHADEYASTDTDGDF